MPLAAYNSPTSWPTTATLLLEVTAAGLYLCGGRLFCATFRAPFWPSYTASRTPTFTTNVRILSTPLASRSRISLFYRLRWASSYLVGSTLLFRLRAEERERFLMRRASRSILMRFGKGLGLSLVVATSSSSRLRKLPSWGRRPLLLNLIMRRGCQKPCLKY